jgi:hypothetical protein
MEAINATRKGELARLIDRFFTQDRNQTGLTVDHIAAMAASWDDHLSNAHAPGHRYEEIYELAVQQYENKAPFSVFDMLGAWSTIQAREQAAARVRPLKCDWEHIDDDMNVLGMFIGNKEEAIMPCPTCRYAAFEQKRKELSRQ